MRDRTSQRKQIRAAIRERLLGNTKADQKVFANRFTSLWDVELPLIAIYTMDEPSSIYAEAPREIERKLRVAIEIVGEDREDQAIDDQLDDIAQQVEDILSLDHTLCDLCRDVVLTNTEFMADPNADKLVASLRLTFEVTYYTLEVAIDENTELPNLARVNNTWRQSEDMVDADAGKDQVEFPTR